MGRPDFQSRGPQIPVFKGFWDLWTESRGALKTPNSTTTDLTPHLRPSDYANSSAEPSCRTPKVPQNSAGEGGGPTRLLRTGFLLPNVGLRALPPLTAFKNDPRTPNLSKLCPDDSFSGFQAGGPKFAKNLCRKIEKQQSGNCCFSSDFQQILCQISKWNPETDVGTNFGQILGFGAFLNAVRGGRGWFATQCGETCGQSCSVVHAGMQTDSLALSFM